MLYLFGIHVDEYGIELIRAATKRGPVLLLPTHKSHVDYLIVTHFCITNGLPLPYVIAGDNLNIPLVRTRRNRCRCIGCCLPRLVHRSVWLVATTDSLDGVRLRQIGRVLRASGAIFIRRSFSGDADRLYSVIFGEYIQQLLARGNCIECFIEGGRSRSGKVRARHGTNGEHTSTERLCVACSFCRPRSECSLASSTACSINATTTSPSCRCRSRTIGWSRPTRTSTSSRAAASVPSACFRPSRG